jgi:hypothetical protein
MAQDLSRNMAASEVPVRRTIASYATYAQAQRAIDRLADAKFPVERTAIVAEGISYVEQVTGRRGWVQAALGGSRDFTSVSGVRADHYALMVDDEVAAEAQRLLQLGH